MSKESNEELIALLQKVHNAGATHEGYTLLEGIYERHEKFNPRACVEEIRLDGSNTLASIFRKWEGVDYDEIVADVAEKLGIDDKYITNNSIDSIELQIVGTVTKKYWDKLSDDEREKIEKHIQSLSYQEAIKATDILKGLKCGGPAFQAFLFTIGEKAAQKLVVEMISGVIGVQATGQVARTTIGMIIPGINILLGAWLLFDITGPAFRKTIPTVVSVALLRLMVRMMEEEN